MTSSVAQKRKNTPKLLLKDRNYLVFHPLMHKGRIHHHEKVDVARIRERKRTKLELAKIDLFSLD